MRWLRQNLGFVLFMLGLLVARSSFADHYVVPSGSMEDTLFPGDRVLVDKRAYGLRVPFTLARVTRGDAPARGDVVVFDAPDDGTRLIKRIVAVGGDVIEGRAGHTLINGVPHEEKTTLELRMVAGPDYGPALLTHEPHFLMLYFRHQ